MIQPNQIASGLAESLLTAAQPNANLKLLIEDAFRRGLRLGLSIRVAFRDCPTRALLYEKEARHGPC